ncbi:MAG: hypothetical protein DPW14_12160 [Planctomycetes bacterium]|nr:hypothetical protein [Planctomycetota bacterium]
MLPQTAPVRRATRTVRISDRHLELLNLMARALGKTQQTTVELAVEQLTECYFTGTPIDVTPASEPTEWELPPEQDSAPPSGQH